MISTTGRSSDDRRRRPSRRLDGSRGSGFNLRHTARFVAAVIATVASLTLLPSDASAEHVESVVVLDSGGIDQVDGGGSASSQSDLTAVIVGPHGEFGFAWDETALTGANSSDTCTYYIEPDDTVTAICFSVKYTNGVVAEGFPVWEVFDCGTGYDPDTQKCGPNAPTSGEFSADCTVPVLVDGYFEGDTDQDLQATCTLTSLDGSDVDSLLLLNSCSKSSASPSSASKDCVFSGPVVFLELIKVVDGGTADPTEWTLSATGPSSLSGSGGVLPTPVQPGDYTLNESAGNADYELDTIVCSTDDGPESDVTETKTITLEGNFTVTTCTFTNTLKPGEIIVAKVTDPADDTTTSFSFNTDYLDAPVAITNGTSFTSGDLVAGAYSVTEVPTPGWEQTSAVCVSDIDPTDTSTLGSIDLDSGETITCTVTNTKLASANVTKTGVVTGQEEWSWTLDKAIDLDGSEIDTDDDDDEVAFAIDQGDSVAGNYTVTVDGSSEVTNASVNWDVQIENPRDGDMMVAVDDPTIGALSCSVAGEPVTADENGLYTIPAGSTMSCIGQTAVDVRSNTVTVSVYDLGVVTSVEEVTADATGDVTQVDYCVDLTDSLYPELSGEICGDEVEAGAVTFPASAAFDSEVCGPHSVVNTASLIDQDDDSTIASDTVTVDYTTNCEVMDVSKSGTITGDEVWTWEVDKNIDLENAEEDDVANLEVAQGATLTGQYEIVVSGSSEVQNGAVDWTVTITNPRSTDETITIDDPLLGTLDCVNEADETVDPDGSGNYPIGAGETITCTGSSAYEDTENTVTVTVVGEAVGGGATATAEGSLNVLDGCAALTDSLYPEFGDDAICGDELDQDGNYVVPIEPVDFDTVECGDYSVLNTAAITGNSETDFGDDTVTVNYEVSCADLVVDKSGIIDATTTWTWDLDKNIDLDEEGDDQVELIIPQGETETGNYEIAVSGSSNTVGSTRWTVTVDNPRLTPVTVRITDPTVGLSCDGEGVTSPAEGVYTIPAGGALTCTGTSAYDVTNNTVTVEELDGDEVVGTYSSTADATGDVDVIDECVDFTDSVYGDLNRTICGGDLDETGQLVIIKSDVAFGGVACGPGSVVNEARLANRPGGDVLATDTVTVDFAVECDDVGVSKAGELDATTTWTWDVDKSIDLDEDGDGLVDLELTQGETVTGNYEIEVSGSSQTEGGVAWRVEVHNPRLTPVTVSVTDLEVALSCNADPVEGYYTIPAGETLVCTGTSDHDETANTVIVNEVEDGEIVNTIEVDAVAAGEITVVDECVDFTDSVYGDLDREVCGGDLPPGGGTLTITKSDVSFGSNECGPHSVVNTAALDDKSGEELASDSVTVDYTVICEGVTASKEGTVSGDVVWTWELDKRVDLDGQAIDGNPEDDLVDFSMSKGSSMPVNYTVDLSASSEVVDAETNWTVTVDNPRLTPVMVRVTDDAVALDCSVDGEPVDADEDGLYTIPAGSSLVCEGTSAHDATHNEALVEVVEDGVVADTIELSSTAGGGLTVVDRCVDITDSLYPELNRTICVEDLTEGALSLGVSGVATAEGECGGLAVTENTAAASGADSGTVVDDTVTVNVTIQCEFEGCTHTRGYWRTHSEYGPAPYDETWAEVGGADALFLDSGLTYLEVLSTSPRGDKWFILAQQYIAAELNLLSGSDPAVISDEMAAAYELLSGNGPGTLTKRQGRQAVSLASHLDAYNNGDIGPGHCG